MTKNLPLSKEAPVPVSLDDHNVFLFMEHFENETVKPVIEFILRKNMMPVAKRPKYLQLVINSPGGEVPSAMALIDVMKGSAIPVHTLGLGQISSCGILTFMAGSKGNRVLTPNTTILSHQYSWGSVGKEHELIAATRAFDLVSEKMMSLYRSCTGLSDKKIREFLLPPQDIWLSAEEAVKHGIADKIKKMY